MPHKTWESYQDMKLQLFVMAIKPCAAPSRWGERRLKPNLLSLATVCLKAYPDTNLEVPWRAKSLIALMIRRFKPVIFLACLIPLALLGWKAYSGTSARIRSK